MKVLRRDDTEHGVDYVTLHEAQSAIEDATHELRHALSGRTVSCSNCNALADENADLCQKVHSLEFRLAQEKHINTDHEQDYFAVWKLIKKPNETVVQAAQRLKNENAAMREVLKEAYDALSDIASVGREYYDMDMGPNGAEALNQADFVIDKLQPYLK